MNSGKENMVRLRDDDEQYDQDCIKVDLRSKCIIRLGEKMICHKDPTRPCTILCPLCGFDDESVEFYCGQPETVRYEAKVIK